MNFKAIKIKSKAFLGNIGKKKLEANIPLEKNSVNSGRTSLSILSSKAISRNVREYRSSSFLHPSKNTIISNNLSGKDLQKESLK
jgi:hypothetical protein